MTTTTITHKENIMDVDAIIANAATDSASKKKSNTPTFQVDDIAAQIASYKDAKRQKTTAEAKMAMIAEETIIPKARDLHSAHVKSSGKVITTIKLQTEDDSIDVDIAKNQYSKISVTNEPDLKKEFGKKYEIFFAKKLEIKLTESAIADKDILAKLIKAVGQENFVKYFKVEHNLVPTEAFHNARFLDDALSTKMDKVIGEVVKPYSPAIRG